MGKKCFNKQLQLERIEEEFWSKAKEKSRITKEKRGCLIRTKSPDPDNILKTFKNTQNLIVYRNPKDWTCKTYNPEKQQISLFSHVYCKYPAPLFMIEFFVGDYGIRIPENKNLFLKWFEIITSGESFRTYSSSYLTRKEQHLFLTLNHEKQIPGFESHFWLAKCIAAGLASNFTTKLILKMHYRNIDPTSYVFKLTQDTINFFSRYNGMLRTNEFEDVLDFIFHHIDEENFSYKGRTLASIISLSNRWHRDRPLLSRQNTQYMEATWPGLFNDKTWSHTYTLNDIKTLITIREICSFKELNKEGQKMHHCVSSYVNKCVAGMTHIFSYKANDENALTIEVSGNRICQIRGKFNRAHTNKELEVIRRWAREVSLIV